MSSRIDSSLADSVTSTSTVARPSPHTCKFRQRKAQRGGDGAGLAGAPPCPAPPPALLLQGPQRQRRCSRNARWLHQRPQL